MDLVKTDLHSNDVWASDALHGYLLVPLSKTHSLKQGVATFVCTRFSRTQIGARGRYTTGVSMKHCKYLVKVQYTLNEVGGGLLPTVMPDQWKCQLDLGHIVMEWEKCQHTPYDGPCWQMKDQFTVEQWGNWAKGRVRSG